MLWVTWGQISENLVHLFWFYINWGVFNEHTRQSGLRMWYLPSIHEVVSSIPTPCKPGLMVHACNLSKWEMQAGRTRVQGHPQLHSRRGYPEHRRLDLKGKNVKKKKKLTFLCPAGLLKLLPTGEVALAVKSTCCKKRELVALAEGWVSSTYIVTHSHL